MQSNQFTVLDGIFKLIREKSGRNDKLEEVKNFNYAYSKVKTELLMMLDLAMNPTRNFYHSSFKGGIPIETNSITLTGNDIYDLQETLLGISKHQYRGQLGQSMMQQLINLHPHLLEWLNYILQGDFELGLQYDSINKVLPDFTLPSFDVKLCQTYEDVAPIRGRYYVEPKYDGYRLTIIPVDGELKAFSRNGKQLYNCDNIIKEIKERESGWMNLVFDGEAYCEDWSSTSSIVKTESEHPNKDKLRLMLFDICWLSEWVSGKFLTIQSVRTEMVDKLTADRPKYLGSLKSLRKTLDFSYIYLPDTETIDPAYITAQQERVDLLVEEYIGLGYEGLVLKHTEATYSFERDADWLKAKLWNNEDFKIVSFVEGKGRLKGMCGKVEVDIDGVIVGCGTGMDDEIRKYIWDNRSKLVDTYVEVSYQVGAELVEGTTDKYKKSYRTPEGSLRFPVFVRLRDDK